MSQIIGASVQQDAAQDEIARLQRMSTAWRRYYGDHPDTFKRQPGRPNDNVKINYARLIVDKGVSFLFGRSLSWELSEGEQTPEEQYLAQVWDANRRDQLLHNLALYGGICGHAYCKILLTPAPRLVALNPQHVRVFWEPSDVSAVWRYRIEYPTIDRDGRGLEMRQEITLSDNRQSWEIVDSWREPGSRAWRETQRETWHFPFPPIADGQNLPDPSAYYGVSDIEADVLGLNECINFVLSNMRKTLRYHAHPKTYATGITARDLVVDADQTIILPNPQATLRNLEMQSDLTSSLEYYKHLKSALHEIARVPEVSTGKLDNAGSLSGIALQILYQTLIEKTLTKRLYYGEMLIELNRRLLAIGGHGDHHRVTLQWSELIPSDPKQEREVALLDEQLGVSRDTLLGRLGYDPTAEAAKREVSAEQMAEDALRAFDQGLSR